MFESRTLYFVCFFIAGLLAGNLGYAETSVTESADWQPFDFPRQVKKGSVLDFSGIGLLDVPAGKYGRIIVRNEHFVFEKLPGKALRFYGTNIYFDVCFAEKANAEKLADLIASCGYNSVRIHNYDHLFVSADDPTGLTLNLEKLDRLYYLFKCLKEKGIYVTIDLYTLRPFQFAGRKVELHEAKMALLLDESSMDNLLQFSRKLLSDVNPYTGLALKDDPALIFISCINEDTLFSLKNSKKMSAEGKALFNDAFNAWLKSRNVAESSPERRDALEAQFISEVTGKAFQKMSAFLRELGVTAPLTDQNFTGYPALATVRSQYDYVDNHCYWAHPSFIEKPWRLPAKFDPASSLARMNPMPSFLFATRILGKPFTMSEYNYCFPNPCRAEGGCLMGAYSALQDWDAVFRFGYVGKEPQLEHDDVSSFFNGINDPMQLISDRLGVLLFLRGDVKPSALTIPVSVDPGIIVSGNTPKEYPKIAAFAGLVGKVGSVIGDGKKTVLSACSSDDDKDIPKKLKAAYDFGAGELDLDRKYARSSTGEIELDAAAGWIKVVTPRSEVVVTVKDGSFSGKIMSVDNKKDFASISISSLDGEKIENSRRMLVLHLTNSLNTMTRFRDEKMNIIESYGTLPHLARRGVAELSFKLTPGDAPKVYAVDLGGNRLGEVKAAFTSEGLLSFTADTFRFKTPCFVYEIAR